jgi:hypothetical protein
LCAFRHCAIFQQIGGLVRERKELGIHEKEQGFLTNLNRFVNRKEAYGIAEKANQIINKLSTNKRELDSSHLY